MASGPRGRPGPAPYSPGPAPYSPGPASGRARTRVRGGAGPGAARMRGAASPAGPQPRGGGRFPRGPRAPLCSGSRPSPFPTRRRGRPRDTPPFLPPAGPELRGDPREAAPPRDVADGHVRNLRYGARPGVPAQAICSSGSRGPVPAPAPARAPGSLISGFGRRGRPAPSAALCPRGPGRAGLRLRRACGPGPRSSFAGRAGASCADRGHLGAEPAFNYVSPIRTHFAGARRYIYIF